MNSPLKVYENTLDQSFKLVEIEKLKGLANGESPSIKAEAKEYRELVIIIYYNRLSLCIELYRDNIFIQTWAKPTLIRNRKPTHSYWE